ncbi:PREDICTED: nicastrin [Papilio xuthus]|uniref:Nicastrin n=1 Tax=Papilio xuthus TaxID=66420 RepID=A0AAJ6Z8D9_PAPXU|nr:PREDICTED: nicastrin [Papilio xuthus]
MAYKKIILLLSVVLVIRLSQCERLHEQIYSSIEGGAACFQRLNGTHQAGCKSPMNGAVGVVQMIDDVSDAAWLVNNATAGPYMAVVNTAMFLDVIDLFMLKSDNVAGILIYQNGTARPKTFSQESTCPNEVSSDPASQCPASSGVSWNMGGTGLLRRNIPFPIFYLPQTRIEEIDKINNCFQRYNLDRANQNGKPLCSIQLKSFMFAAVNSEVCLRRSTTSALLTPTKVCDPLGDQNVYFSLFPRGKGVEVKTKPITLVTARIDSASLFDGLAPGAASSVVGMVTLLMSAVTLSKMLPISDSQLYDSNVVWNLFNGESYDYIGSQRVAYEMKFGAWPTFAPMDSSDVKLHVELGQIGGSLNLYSENASWPLYAYAADSYTPVTEFLNEMLTNAKQFNMTLLPVFTKNIPPSSLHSFRRILKNETESGEFPEVLLVDYKDTFTNAYYESVFDDADNIGFVYRNISVGPDGEFVPTSALLANGTMREWDVQVKISRLATALALTLYQRVGGKPYADDVDASAHLADEMLYCFLRSQACRLLLAADYATSTVEVPVASAAPLYVGVAAQSNTPAIFAGHLLALLAGTHLPLNKTGCDALNKPGFSYYWLRGWNHTGVCMQTTMNFTQAVSPAFLLQDYDMSSGMYSTWTESVWAAMWARVFVSGSGGGARAAALAGAAATLAAALLTYWLSKHADLLFKQPADSIANDAASGILRTVNC